MSAAALLSTSLAAAASAAPIRVDGDHVRPSGLTYASQQCSDDTIQPPTEPKVHITRGPKTPPLGNQSLGWDMQDQTTYGAGVLSHVPDPKSLKKASIKVFFVGGSGQGSAYAVYHAPSDPGVWKGVAALQLDATPGWHRVNVSKVEFNWRYTGDTQSGEESAMTLQDLAARHGGNGRGAEIGVLFGCTGESFYVDDLEVSSRKVDRTYDLGGYRTLSDIIWGSAVRKKITITYGQRLGLTGRLRARYDSSRVSGALSIQAKPYGATRWRKFERVSSGGDFKVSPARSTTYRSMFDGSERYRASEPKNLQVLVRSVVKAGLADNSVTKGKTFTARGRVLPGHSAKVALQRFLHKKWTTVKTGRSGKDGRYHLSLTAKSLGTSYWRVTAATGGGNLGNHSNQMKLKVTKPAASGGGGGGTYDPPPPPDDPPPPTEPPPPSH
ncbi:hypothetical protein [Nocardioides koreensis]